MARVYLIIGFIALAFTIYAFVDCLISRREIVRALPKPLWALLIIVLSPVGGILWFALGKDRSNGRAATAAMTTTAPDDDPAFLRRLNEDKARDERIRELEQQLAELDDDHNDSKD